MLAFSTNHLANTMRSSSAENAIMTIGKVVYYRKVIDRTIYRLAAAKMIPYFRGGCSWHFSKADIDWQTREQSTSTQSSAATGRA